MSGFKDNLEEQYQRRKYKSRSFWYTLILSIMFGIIFLTFFGFGRLPISSYFFSMPFANPDTRGYYFLELFLMVSLTVWWYGAHPLFVKIVKPLGILYKIKPFKIFLPEEQKLYKIQRGKRHALEDFFYPTVAYTDGVPRARKAFFFNHDNFSLDNIFDYHAESTKADKDGTNKIKLLFRDKKMETLKKRALSQNKKVAARAKELIAERNKKYISKGLPTPEQEEEYNDLFQAIEGIYHQYESEGENNKIFRVSQSSPLELKIEDGEIVNASVNESIDVFKDGKVYFSLKMVTMTTAKLTILYMHFLKKRLAGQSRFSQKQVGDVLLNGDNISKFENIFKLMMFRRILLNYGGIPSGWFCTRIEDYDTRAIVSAIDRELIPSISSTNDGSNSFYNSDVVASTFLFTYWAFMKDPQIFPIIDKLDWQFNTIKEVSEIKAWESSKIAAQKIEREFYAKEQEMIKSGEFAEAVSLEKKIAEIAKEIEISKRDA